MADRKQKALPREGTSRLVKRAFFTKLTEEIKDPDFGRLAAKEHKDHKAETVCRQAAFRSHAIFAFLRDKTNLLLFDVWYPCKSVFICG